MLVIRITFDIYGETFSPKEVLDKIQGDFIVFDSNECDDPKAEGELEPFEFGSMSIVHPMKIGIEYELEPYEEWYINFIECNYEVLIKHGAEDFKLYYETFYTKQCNFAILNNPLIKRLSKYNVSIPVSVYKLSNSQLKEVICDSAYSKDKIKDMLKNM